MGKKTQCLIIFEIILIVILFGFAYYTYSQKDDQSSNNQTIFEKSKKDQNQTCPTN